LRINQRVKTVDYTTSAARRIQEHVLDIFIRGRVKFQKALVLRLDISGLNQTE
jgi:hypothetical protein